MDFLPLTDHRTYDQHGDPQWTSSALPLIPGEAETRWNQGFRTGVTAASENVSPGVEVGGVWPSLGRKHQEPEGNRLMNAMQSYRHAQDGFDAMLAAVPPEAWDSASACAGWSVRDVAGHVIWGQEQMRHWATGQEYTCMTGAPGAPHPGEMAGADPVATWRAARARCVETLTDEALSRKVTLPGMGEVPVSALLSLLVTDHLAHTWDIGHALGREVRLDDDLVAGSFEWARENVVRAPGFFGPELTPPAEADEQTRWLAFLGRASWQPVSA
jgi:uncharacterized protein (TIGR03086 family)